MIFSLGISHTPWIADRVVSLSRLIDSLEYRPPFFRLFTDREPNWAWAQKMWNWALGCGADSCLFLQDDAIAGPNFWPNLRTMVEAVPDKVIGLESVHDAVPMLHKAGVDFYTTSDGLIGVGYVFPLSLLRSFLDWRTNRVRADGARRLNEDQLIGIWAASTGNRIWHPTTTIIDHDTEIASTYANDAHSHRRPVRTTVRGDVGSWVVPAEVPHFGCFYGATPYLCRRWVKGVSMQDVEAMR